MQPIYSWMCDLLLEHGQISKGNLIRESFLSQKLLIAMSSSARGKITCSLPLSLLILVWLDFAQGVCMLSQLLWVIVQPPSDSLSLSVPYWFSMWMSANVLCFLDSESSTNWHNGNKHWSGRHTEDNRPKNASFLHACLNFSKATPLKISYF